MNKNFAEEVRETLPRNLVEADAYFVCIGTDRSTGDALGPLVGSALKQIGYTNVIGTIEEPCHAMNIQELVEGIPEGKTIIAVDSTLGKMSEVGRCFASKGPCHPGAGVGKSLSPVGDYRILGCVNVGGFMEYFVLQNTRLSLVFKVVDEIVDAITKCVRPESLEMVAVTNWTQDEKGA